MQESPGTNTLRATISTPTAFTAELFRTVVPLISQRATTARLSKALCHFRQSPEFNLPRAYHVNNRQSTLTTADDSRWC